MDYNRWSVDVETVGHETLPQVTIRAVTHKDPKGRFVHHTDAEELEYQLEQAQAGRDAALARLKELEEGLDIHHRLRDIALEAYHAAGGETSFGAADWLKARLERLAELEKGGPRAIADIAASYRATDPGNEDDESLKQWLSRRLYTLPLLKAALLHLGDWYTEYKVPIRATTFWKNEVRPLLGVSET